MVMEDDGGAKSGDLSNFGAGVNLLKFMIGLGIISLPYATAQVGWIPSLYGLAVVAFITAAGLFLGVMSRERLDHPEFEENRPLVKDAPDRWQDVPTFGLGSFDQIVGFTLGWKSQYLYALCIAIGQFATGVVYVDVITDTNDFHLRICGLLGVGVALSILSLIPTLRGVAMLSGLGLLIYIFLFVVLIGELTHGPEPSAVMINHNHANFGKWFGISSFAFGVFPIAFVIYDDMRDRASFYKVTGWTVTACWAIYAAFAIIGYMCYGSDTEILIFENFPAGSLIRNGSYAALTAILIFSYVIQMMPLYNWAAQTCSAWKSIGHFATSYPVIFTALTRWPLVWLTVAVAFVVPNVAKVIDTAGAMTAVLSGFVFPAVVYMVLSSSHEWKERLLCLLVIVVGTFGGIASVIS